MKSIAYEWVYRYALLLRLDSPVLRDHDRGLPGAHPVRREGVVIIAATRGQQHLGDNGLATVPTRRGHGRPSGPGAGTTAEYGPRGTCRPPVGAAPPSCLHVDGSLWCARQPLGYTRDTILGDLSQGLGLLLGEDLPRPIVLSGLCGEDYDIRVWYCSRDVPCDWLCPMISPSRQIGQHVALAPSS